MAHQGPQRPWSLTGPALERLLVALDSDPKRAAIAYQRLHERVSGLFQWWGAASAAETLADQALDRVARKLEEGVVIHAGSFGAYVRGVARMVFYESGRRGGEQRPLRDANGLPAPPPEEDSGEALACLDRCLATLGSEARSLILGYYGGGKKSEVRQRLAGELGISLTALRIRTHRLRQTLERCVAACLERT